MKKYQTYIDEQQFQQLKKEATEQANKVLEGIEALRAEGISTDEKTITMLTATPDALEKKANRNIICSTRGEVTYF